MSKNGFWYGYLEAGDKSTAVLRDSELDTGNKKTVFLFNLARKQILEYTLAIVEPKLRGLKTSEQALIEEIDGAYPSARKGFVAARRSMTIPDSGPAPKRAEKAPEDDFDLEEAEEDADTEPLMDEDEEEEV